MLRVRSKRVVVISMAVLSVAIIGLGTLVYAATAAHPVIVQESDSTALLLGGTVNGKWLSARSIAPKLGGRTEYRLYSAAKPVGSAVGGRPKHEQGDIYSIATGKTPTDYRIGIAGNWNPFPRRARDGDVRSSRYPNAVRRFLTAKGLKRAPVRITSVKLVDLQGDGRDEAIVSAQSPDWEPWNYTQGQYSVVLLVDRKSKTCLIAGEVHAKPLKDSYPMRYEYGGVWDIDGDGALEVCIDWACERADSAGVALYHWGKGGLRQMCNVGLGH